MELAGINSKSIAAFMSLKATPFAFAFRTRQMSLVQPSSNRHPARRCNCSDYGEWRRKPRQLTTRGDKPRAAANDSTVLGITPAPAAKQDWCLKLLEDESNPEALRAALDFLDQVGGEGQEPRLARATLHALGRMSDKLLNLNHDDGSRRPGTPLHGLELPESGK